MVANPILDGQHAKYIEKQLHDLKKDLRIHAQMQGIAKTLDDKQIADLSKAFASKKWANPNPKSNPKIQEEVKTLYERGIAHGVMVLSLRVRTTFRDWQDKGLNI